MSRIMARILALTFGLQQVKIGGVIIYDWIALVFIFSLILEFLIRQKIKIKRMPMLIISIFFLGVAVSLSLMRVSIEWPEFMYYDVLQVMRILVGVFTMFGVILTVKSYSEIVKLLEWMLIGASVSFILVLNDFIAGFFFGDFSSSAWLGQRFIGMFNDPNYFSIYTASMCAISLGFLLCKSIQHRNILVNFSSFILLLLGPIYIMASGSRGGFLGICATVLGLLVGMRIWSKHRLLMVLSTVTGLLFFFFLYFENPVMQIMVHRLHDPLAAQARHVTWPIVFDIITSNPVIGVGFWNVAEITYDKTGISTISHNTILQIYASLGILGIASLIFMIFELTNCSIQLRRRSRETFHLLLLPTLAMFPGLLLLDFLEVRWMWFLCGLWLSKKGGRQ